MDSSDITFKDDIAEGLVLVDFWAPWCGPCRAVSPILDKIAEEYGLKLVKVDVDENTGVSGEYAVTSIPAIKLFKDGVLVKSITGAKPKPAIEHDLAEWLSPSQR